MKIVQAVGWYYPESVGGTEVYVSALSRLLASAGHEVIVAAPRAGAERIDEYHHDGRLVWRYPIAAAPTREEAQGRVAVRGADAFHRWLRAIRPDVVHLHTFVTGLGLDEVKAAQGAGARVIVTTHSSSLGFICQRGTLMRRGEVLCDGHLDVARCADCDLQARGIGQALSSAIARLPLTVSAAAASVPGRVGTALGMPSLIAWNRQRQTDMLSRVDAFVVLTSRAAAMVVDNGAPRERVAVNRLGVSQAFSTPPRRTAAERVRVGYVGRFDPVKGVLDLAEAIRRLPPALPLDFEFRGPVNSDRDRATLDELRNRCGDDRRVSFAPVVPIDDIPAVMAAYDVVCYPSRCLEGGPTAGLEAIAAGTPAIGADAGGLAEVIADNVNGRLVAPGDIDALVAVLDAIGRSPQIVDRWRAQLPRVRTMADVARDYETLYAA
jgi:glycosyltransferase involved in cell wall biosynthesis